MPVAACISDKEKQYGAQLNDLYQQAIKSAATSAILLREAQRDDFNKALASSIKNLEKRKDLVLADCRWKNVSSARRFSNSMICAPTLNASQNELSRRVPMVELRYLA